MKKRTMRKWLALAWLLYTMLMLTAVGLIISIALPLTPPMARSTAPPTH